MSDGRRGHVEEVEIARCGWWGEGNCPGDETGCHDNLCQRLRKREAEEVVVFDDVEKFLEFGPARTISHKQFLRDYNRCPKQCCSGHQLSLLDG